MTEQNTPIILDETEEPARQLVQLAAEHEVDYGSGSTMLLTASLKQSGVHFRRMASDEEQKDFSLDAEEADAFVAAWATFKHKQEQKAKAEEERQAQIVNEAYELAGKCSAIQIEELAPCCWRVSCPDSGWITSHPAYDANSFLRDVKNAQADYARLLPAIEARRREQASGDAA